MLLCLNRVEEYFDNVMLEKMHLNEYLLKQSLEQRLSRNLFELIMVYPVRMVQMLMQQLLQLIDQELVLFVKQLYSLYLIVLGQYEQLFDESVYFHRMTSE